MKKFLCISVLFLALSCSVEHKNYDSVFPEDRIDRIAYPIGGLGTGMFTIEGTGAVSHMSLHHRPNLFSEPCMFAAIHVDGVENGTKVVEARIPEYKKYGRSEGGLGCPGTSYGLPRFEHGEFSARFPFAKVSLQDDDLPLTATIEEPHHNTYDIEFWGPDGMCTSFYAGALSAFIKMAEAAGDDASAYEELLGKCQNYMSEKLWNGEYFYQQVRWKDLAAEDPTEVLLAQGYENSQEYKPEALAILEKEGPKYQYGTGCLSDGIIGAWMALCAGLEDPVDQAKVKSHLESVYKYNLKKDLFDIANPQRPGFALGHEGGLLLCSWPNGGKPNLPFVYSDEVWTGIEFQVAAHLMFEGDVEQGLDIVRTCLDRTLYIDSRVGDDFRSFLSVEGGYATVGLKAGKPFVEVRAGEIPVEHCYVSGKLLSL